MTRHRIRRRSRFLLSSPVALRAASLLAAVAMLAALPACSPPPASVTGAAAFPSALPLPTELETALDSFRAEGPKGWAFTQTTRKGDKNLVERHDPRHPGSARWTLLVENDRAPTEEEQQRYRGSRPPVDAVSNVAAQLDRASAVVASKDERSTTYEFRLVPGSEKDKAAAHMRARVTFDHPAKTIVHVELFSVESFKPATSLTIHDARTTMTYSLPTDTAPSLPQEVTMLVRGERFWFRDFEEKVVSTYSEFEKVSAAAAEK